MKRRTAWILVALVAAVAVGASIVGGAVFVLSGGASKTSWGASGKKSLYVDLTGPLPERYSSDFGSLLEKRPPSLRTIVDSIDRAAKDPSVSSVALRLGFLPDAGWGKVQEIREALGRFRKTGKQVSAFIESGGNKEYYLATACSRVYALPTAILDITGLSVDVTFLKKSLDKLGVQAQFEGVGKYKNAPNQFTESAFTAPHREQMEALLDSLFAEYLGAIAKSRGRTPEEVRGLLDAGPYDGKRAKAVGLIDDVLYDDQLPADGQRLTPGRYMRDGRARFFDSRPKLALVYAVGDIVTGESQQTTFGSETAGSSTVAQALREARQNDEIRAIVVRVDSPGGSGAASDVMWREMKLASAAKPVIVSMGDYAASGGYYVAMGGSGIVAQPGTLTGSIGVFSGKFSLRGLYDKIGVSKEIVDRGRFASLFTEYRPWSDEERLKVREMNVAFYDEFIAKAAEGRHRDKEAIHEVAQGRVWSGTDALKVGLVDRLGGMQDAIAWAKDKARIAANQDVSVVVLPEEKGLFETIWERQEEVANQRSLAPELREALVWLTGIGQGRVSARLPFSVRIR